MDLSTLFEMDWYDKSPMTAVLRRNVGRWIHFSKGVPNRDAQSIKTLPGPSRPDNPYDRKAAKQFKRAVQRTDAMNAVHRVPKLGVNPKSFWNDPKGVYFYPVSFALSGTERITTSHQYGFDFPYFYIAELNLNDPNGVNLGTITWDQIEAIARRNGWFDAMQEFRNLPADEQKKQLFSYSRPDLPGSFLWHFIDRQVKDHKMSWLQAFRGISFIRDPNLSIIHNYEPDQVLVLDPRIIKIVEFGENKRPITPTDRDRPEHWQHALISIIKTIRGEFGGDLTWEKKRPTLNFNVGIAKFMLTIGDSYSGRLRMTYTYGRATGDMSFPDRELEETSFDTIVHSLKERITRVGSRKTDLLFKPFIGVDDAKRLLSKNFADDLDLTFTVNIYNPETPSERQSGGRLSIVGETVREVDRVTIKTQVSFYIENQNFSGNCSVYAGKHHLIATSNAIEDYTDLHQLFDQQVMKMSENLQYMLRSFEPGPYDSYRRHPRFGEAAQVPAFIGWLMLNSGLNLDGRVASQFAEQIAAFETYKDRRNLLSEIGYVLNSRF